MRRGLVLVLLAALAAFADDGRKASVTTFVVQDARTLLHDGVSWELSTGPDGLDGYSVEPSQHETTGWTEGPLVEAATPFDRACVSVNAGLRPGSKVEVFARVHLQGDAITDWLPLGTLEPGLDGVRSAKKFESHSAKVDIDTIVLPHAKGRAIQVKLVITKFANVRRIVITAWRHGARDEEPANASHPAWGKELSVPERSQRVEDPKISGRICSATSLGMVLAYHGHVFETAAVCSQVYDPEAKIYGNWACNVAFAGRLGFDAAIGRMGSFAPLEAEIAAGRPVVLTHRFSKGELSNAPISATDGHLIVCRGFTKDGDLIVNDPAADPRHGQTIRRIYKRAEIEKTWLGHGDGVCYLIVPRVREAAK